MKTMQRRYHRTNRRTTTKRAALYSEYQPRYADLGVAVFPCVPSGDRKKPLVTNYQKMGLPAAAELAKKKKFANADTFGFIAGTHNRITVLDVDVPDRSVLDAAIARHGEPRLIVQTASGKFHAYYRHNRERRSIRAWGDELPIDLLGGGVIVAHPSIFNDGQYRIIHGTLDDIRNLTPLRGIEAHLYRHQQQQAAVDRPRRKVREGNRNNTLWSHCVRAAHHCDDIEVLIDVARTRNEEFEPPLEETEVMQVAQSAWKYTAAGDNRYGVRGAWMPQQEIASMMQEPDVLALLMWLRANEGPDATFWVANGLAESHFGWGRHRFVQARRRLLEEGVMVQIQKPHQGSPALYRWA
jgi:hypothetical protein